MACEAPYRGSCASQDREADYRRLVVKALRGTREGARLDLAIVLRCLSLPQRCSLSQRQQRISAISSQLDQGASPQQLQQILDKDFTNDSAEEGKSQCFKISKVDPKKLSPFIMEVQQDTQQAKQLLRKFLNTCINKGREARPVSPVSYQRKDPTQLYSEILKQRLLDLARKPLPDLYKESSGAMSDDYADDSETAKLQMINIIAASPTTVELLPDLCSLVFRNQRCTLQQHILQDIENIKNAMARSDCPQAEPKVKDVFKCFLQKMMTFLDTPGWLSGLQLCSLVCASTILLEPVFSLQDKEEMGDLLFESFISLAMNERAQRARELREQQSTEAAADPVQDPIQDNMMEDYFGADDPDNDDGENESKGEESKDEETAEIDPEAAEWGCSVQ